MGSGEKLLLCRGSFQCIKNKQSRNDPWETPLFWNLLDSLCKNLIFKAVVIDNDEGNDIPKKNLPL
jgi:hypothetical protein